MISPRVGSVLAMGLAGFGWGLRRAYGQSVLESACRSKAKDFSGKAAVLVRCHPC